ncbi:MAG: hypothetical protein FJX53_03960 [Alphaproteobacteria bacterium]|nr:hypothetical protein [Alphaproteobacteria bacterium]
MTSRDNDSSPPGWVSDVRDPAVRKLGEAWSARARRTPNNMARVSAALPWPKQAVFHVTYAAMRIIDDFVDDDFLARPVGERDRTRDMALARLDRWRRDATAAASGIFAAGAGPEATLFQALSAVCGPRRAVGPEPFRKLADALEHDIRECPLERWSDFHTYAEGAAVAPASIFVTLLASDIDAEFVGRYGLAVSAADHARSLALYCYLVHILRDLAEDARGNLQLLTIPAEVLVPCGLDRRGLAAAVLAGDVARVTPVVRAVADEARRWRPRAMADVAALSRSIGPVERAVIGTLFTLYDEQFDRAAASADMVVAGTAGLPTERVRAILAAGLPATPV